MGGVVLALAVAAFASSGVPDGFTHVRDVGDCAIYQRVPTPGVPTTMRGECRWADVTASQLTALLTDFNRYASFVPPLTESRVVRAESDGALLVYQLQQLRPLADREVLLWARITTNPDGGHFSWTTADDQPLDQRPGSIRTPANVGFYEVGPHPDGGVRLVHQIAIDGGGSIPAWIVNLVRTRGFARVLDGLRDAARDEPR